MKEKSLETGCEDRLAIAGFWTLKQGWEGLPDRQVFRKGSDRSFWIEYKTAEGALSKLQKVRCRDLVEKGHRVYIVRTYLDLTAVIETEYRIARAK